MNRITSLTTTIIIFIFCLNSNAATPKDTTDIKHKITQSLSFRYQDYLGYQSTAVEMYRNYRTSSRTTNAPELHFLGGAFNEQDIIVNGLSFRNPLTGVSDVSFASAFFDDINIYGGAVPVQFSNANSAVIQLSSPKLSTGYHGSFEVLSDNTVENKFDQKYYRGIFSGSLFDNDKLKFWTAFERRSLGDRMPSSLTSEVLAGSPDILPNNQLSGWTYHGKLQYDLTTKSRFIFTVDGAVDKWQEYLHNYNNPSQPGQISHTPRYKDETYGLNALLEQKLSENTQFNLSVGYFKSERIKGDGVIFDNYNAYQREFANPRYDVYNLFKEGDSVPVGAGEFYESYYDGYLHQITSYKQFRGEIIHSIKDIHTIKTGILYKKNRLRYFSDLTPSQGYVRQNMNRYGFDSLGVESDNQSWKNNSKQPTELSLYISDKITIDRLTLNVGVRYDRYDYNALQLRSLARPFDPDTTYSYDFTLDEEDMVATKAHTGFNPQVGFDVQATDNTNLFLNWSLNRQVTPYKNIYVGYDFVEARIGAGRYFPFPTSSLEPVKSETTILGLKSKIGNKMKFGLTFINIDYTKKIVVTIQTPAFPFQYENYSSKGTSSYTGINFLLQYDNGINFGWFIDATKSQATSIDIPRGSIAWKSVPRPELPLDYDRTVKIVAGLSYETNFGLIVNLIAKQESGSPYTPTVVYDAVTIVPVTGFTTGEVNSSRTDKSRVLDLKLEKEFKFSSYTIIPYLFIKNLLDEKFITGVYTATGSPTRTGYLESPEGIVRSESSTTGAEFESRYKLAQNNPLNFYAPRQIFFGIKTSF